MKGLTCRPRGPALGIAGGADWAEQMCKSAAANAVRQRRIRRRDVMGKILLVRPIGYNGASPSRPPKRAVPHPTVYSPNKPAFDPL